MNRQIQTKADTAKSRERSTGGEEIKERRQEEASSRGVISWQIHAWCHMRGGLGGGGLKRRGMFVSQGGGGAVKVCVWEGSSCHWLLSAHCHHHVLLHAST